MNIWEEIQKMAEAPAQEQQASVIDLDLNHRQIEALIAVIDGKQLNPQQAQIIKVIRQKLET